MNKTAPSRALSRTAFAASFALLGAASALAQTLPTPPVRTAPSAPTTPFRADPPPRPGAACANPHECAEAAGPAAPEP